MNQQSLNEDVVGLEQVLAQARDPSQIAHYSFRLARGYAQAGETAKALDAYLRRAGQGFSAEEVYISLLSAARLMEALQHDPDAVIAAYLRAADQAPTRLEALHDASRFCRSQGRNEQGYQIAQRGLDGPIGTDGLLFEAWIHETGLLDEYAVNAFHAGHFSECFDASLTLLAGGKLVGPNLERVAANARFAGEQVARVAAMGEGGPPRLAQRHPLTADRPLRTVQDRAPRVMVAILAKQKEVSLPLYLDCIEALDYPKSAIFLYVRTNNNTDGTERILREWIARVGPLYAGVEFDAEDSETRVEQFGVHEWNPTRFRVLGRIRDVSLQRTLRHDCAFYFVADVDNFVRASTLRELVALDLPIVAPMLRAVDPEGVYSNYHAEVDPEGYYQECSLYWWLLNQLVVGVVEVAVVHCTYLVRADVIGELSYQDETERYEYVVFADSARRADIPQYLDNRQVYGYITATEGDLGQIEDGIDRARQLIAAADAPAG